MVSFNELIMVSTYSAIGNMSSPASTASAATLFQHQTSLADDYSRMLAPGAGPASLRGRGASLLDNIDNVMREFRMNGSDSSIEDDLDCTARYSHFRAGLLGSDAGTLSASPLSAGTLPTGTLGLPSSNPVSIQRQASWPEPQGSSVLDNFLNSLSAASDYATLLSREQQLRQLQLLAAHPDLVSALLQSTRLNRDRRSRKPLPTECAFCKNNGEQESYYSTHTLKDWAGRVTCPVLWAFRCPRCGATGEHAHTIKYCPESTDADHLPSIASLKSYRLALGKRRTPPSFSLQAPASPPWSQGTMTQAYLSSPSDMARRPPLF